MAFLATLPRGATLLDVFRKFPATSKPPIEFHEVLLRGPSPFSEAERELIAAYVSGLNRCRYCHGVHTATAELLGVEQGTLQQLIDGIDNADVAEKMKPVLKYAEKLTLVPGGLTSEEAEAVLSAGWDETALYHVVAVTALFNFMNRLVEGLSSSSIRAMYGQPRNASPSAATCRSSA